MTEILVWAIQVTKQKLVLQSLQLNDLTFAEIGIVVEYFLMNQVNEALAHLETARTCYRVVLNADA